ncbi:tryptophan synthase subunit beta [Shigella sonnei]|nr:tryptophan synthase subunit beta [Shigella sonnei]
MYVPQILMPALRQLEEAFVSAQKDPEFQAQFNDLLKNYAGRPTALTKCQNITAGTNTTLYLKREDCCTAARIKLTRCSVRLYWRSGWVKTEIIAEPVPSAWLASALASALLGLKCRIYMVPKTLNASRLTFFVCA